MSNGTANSAEFNFCYFLAGVLAGASSLPSNGGAQRRKAYAGLRWPTLAATNKCLAQSNKFSTRDKATKKHEFEVEAS